MLHERLRPLQLGRRRPRVRRHRLPHGRLRPRATRPRARDGARLLGAYPRVSGEDVTATAASGPDDRAGAARTAAQEGAPWTNATCATCPMWSRLPGAGRVPLVGGLSPSRWRSAPPTTRASAAGTRRGRRATSRSRRRRTGAASTRSAGSPAARRLSTAPGRRAGRRGRAAPQTVRGPGGPSVRARGKPVAPSLLRHRARAVQLVRGRDHGVGTEQVRARRCAAAGPPSPCRRRRGRGARRAPRTRPRTRAAPRSSRCAACRGRAGAARPRGSARRRPPAAMP